MPIPSSSPASGGAFAKALIDTNQLPLLLLDGEGRIVCASHSFHEMFDIPADGVTGRRLGQIAGGGWDKPQLNLLVEHALGDGPQLGSYETDLHREGLRGRRLQVNVRKVLPGANLADVRVLMTITDLTYVRNAEQANVALLLEKDGLLRERAILMDEMQHRIANSLQIIASVLLLKVRAAKSEETRLHLRDAHNRVMSLAAVQQHLQSTAGNIEVGPYLTKLCESLAASMIREARSLTLEVASDEAMMSSHDAVSLGLVVTELVINALKHAFPGTRAGAIMVSYRVQGKGWTLSVADDGIGMPEGGAPRPGLGASIVHGLARQLGAEVESFDAGRGLRVSLVSTGDTEGLTNLPSGSI